MDIESVIATVTAFLYLLLSVFLFSYKKGNRLSNRILSVFFFFNFIFAALYYLVHAGFWFEYPPLYLTSNSLYYFMGPLLFLYTKSLCYEDFRIQKKSLLHVLPFLFLVASTFAYYHLKPAFVPDAASMNGMAVSPYGNLSRYEILLYFCLLNGLLLFYGILSLNTLAKYRRDLKDQYSNIHAIDLSWLSLIILAYAIVWLLDLIVYLLLFVPGYSSLVLGILNERSGIVNLAFAVLILLKGLKQSDLFTGISGQKYVTARLPQREIETYRKKLEAVMAGRKPHLDPELTLDNLAKTISIPARHLSQVINTGLNQNFFDFVSDHRIHEAKKMLSDPRNNDKTILDILYDAGFNSKSSFNDLFKRKTGMTPSEFRKNSSDKIEAGR